MEHEAENLFTGRYMRFQSKTVTHCVVD